MPLDEQVIAAVMDAVAEHGQPPQLGRRLTSWMTQLVGGNESLDSPDDVAKRVEDVLTSVKVEDEDEED